MSGVAHRARRLAIVVAACAALAAPSAPAVGVDLLGPDLLGPRTQPERVSTSAGERARLATTHARDQRLKHGCHRYTWRYRVRPGAEQWAAEFFLIKPNGRSLASQVADGSYDPKRGKRKWTICSPSTTVGKHKIRVDVTTVDPMFGQPQVRRGKTSTFRLTR